MEKEKNIAVTGGAGFIGANFIHYILEKTSYKANIINIDNLTYAGNLENLKEIEKNYGGKKYFFEKENICNIDAIKKIFKKYDIDTVVHFAAESHVDRSIISPGTFIETNIVGTYTLLEVARELWKEKSQKRFHHVSTDEVYGSLPEEGYFYEETPYDPRSPYSASKASSDHIVRSYFHTYGLPVTLSNCSNNYGPYQFPEKLIPLMILNILEEKPLPVYGDGKNIRDWLYVEDHAIAILEILKYGKAGETYNIGGNSELQNIDLVNMLCEEVAKYHKKDKEHYKHLISYVTDRPGHDRRYAINFDKIKKSMNWSPKYDIYKGIRKTIDWYISHPNWIKSVKEGTYTNWITKNYSNR